MLYLNLDLLENINNYLFPLFYYQLDNYMIIYSPASLKFYFFSLSKDSNFYVGDIRTKIGLCNYKANNYNFEWVILIDENSFNVWGTKYKRTNKLVLSRFSKEIVLKYLKNNKRINLN